MDLMVNNMKTIKKILFLTLLVFIGSIRVSAYDCKNYGCTTCTYKSGSQTYTIFAGSNGTDNLTVNIKKSQKSSVGNDTIKNNFSDSDFKSSGKLKCPTSINVKIVDNMANHQYQFSKGSGIKLTSEDNNNKPIKLSYKNAKECKYVASIIEGSGNPPTVTVKTDGKTHIEYFFSDGTWSIDNKVTNVKAEDFSGSKCPSVYTSCYRTSTYSLCNLTKDKRLDHDGKEYKTDTKFELKRDSTAPRPIKPIIKVNMYISEDGCGILSNDLQEWLQWLLDVIRIGGLVLAVVLGIADYMTATFASNEEGMSKANKNFSTRLLCLAILFLVPTLIEFLLTLLNIGVTAKDPTCGLK